MVGLGFALFSLRFPFLLPDHTSTPREHCRATVKQGRERTTDGEKREGGRNSMRFSHESFPSSPALERRIANFSRRDSAPTLSVFSFVRNLGGTLGLAISGTVMYASLVLATLRHSLHCLALCFPPLFSSSPPCSDLSYFPHIQRLTTPYPSLPRSLCLLGPKSPL